MHRFNTLPGVVIIGTGTLGSELAHTLAHRGTARVLLIDPEEVQPHNLPGSTFLSQALSHLSPTLPHGTASSCFKAPLLQREAARAFHLSWQSLTAEIADVGLGTLAEFGILCSCTDSALSRVETALAARLLSMPMLDCGVFGDNIAAGRVSFFAPSLNAACYLCGMGEDRRAHLLAYAASASLGCAPAPRDVPMTGSSSTVQHTARTAADLLETFAAQGFPERSTAWQLSQGSASAGWSTHTVALSLSSTCTWHNPLPGPLVELPWQTPLAESLQQHFNDEADGLLQLQWPLCTDAVCTHCGTGIQPLQRVARVRRTVHCQHCCHTGSLEPLHCVSTISPGDTLAGFTPQQLHLPQRQLHLLRHAFAWPAL